MAHRRMANIYRWKTTAELKTLRSKKFTKMENLRRDYGYLAMQEIKRLAFNLQEIEAELAFRSAQPSLFS